MGLDALNRPPAGGQTRRPVEHRREAMRERRHGRRRREHLDRVPRSGQWRTPPLEPEGPQDASGHEARLAPASVTCPVQHDGPRRQLPDEPTPESAVVGPVEPTPTTQALGGQTPVEVCCPQWRLAR